MKAASIAQIKRELKHLDNDALVELVLRLSKFKIENKELLTYLLYEAHDEDSFVEHVKEHVDEALKENNRSHIYYIKKTFRKILRTLKKFIRFSKKPETEAALLLYFCETMRKEFPTYARYAVLRNMYTKQLEMAQKAVNKLHEDLQYDFEKDLEELR